MANFKGTDLRVGDTVIIEVGSTLFERKLTAVAHNHIKIDKEASFIIDWCKDDRVRDMLTKDESPWENLESGLTTGVNPSPGLTRWRKLKRRLGWE